MEKVVNLQFVLFLAVLDPRVGQWPRHGRTFSIYLCPLSFGTDSSTETHVHVLMLSIESVRGLPRLRGVRASASVPCIISFSSQLPRSFRHGVTIVRFLALTVSNSNLNISRYDTLTRPLTATLPLTAQS